MTDEMVALRAMLEKGTDADVLREMIGFDAILMDLQMPVIDGLAATRRLRAEDGPNRLTRIIGVTAAVGLEIERRCFEAGMDDYLSKPVQRGALMTALGLTG